jgi:hypothetical protein
MGGWLAGACAAQGALGGTRLIGPTLESIRAPLLPENTKYSTAILS